MTYRGQVQNGVVVFPEPVPIPEGSQVEVTLASPETAPTDHVARRTLRERLKNVIGKAKNLPPDAAMNSDHYLYGMPKK